MLMWVLFASLTTASAALPEGLRSMHAMAEKQSEVIKMADARKEQAGERKERAGGVLLPTLTGRYSYTEIDPPPGQASAFTRINQYSALINLTQPIYRGGAYPAFSYTKIDMEMQQRLREQEGLGLWQATGVAYYNLWIAQNDLANVKKLREFSDERAKELRERVRVGRSRRGELSQAEAQLSSVEADVVRAENTLNAAKESVAFLVGEKLEPQFGALPQSSEAPAPLGEYIKQASERPDIKAKAQEVLLAEKNLDIAKAGHHPTVDFSANYYGLRTGVLKDSKWDVGVAVSLPLYQGGQVMAQSREAAEKKREITLGYEQLKRQADRDVRILWQNLVGLDKVVKDLRVAYGRAESTYNENKKDYRYGLVTSLDVLVSLNDYISTKRNLERAILEKELLSLQLKVASGVTP